MELIESLQGFVGENLFLLAPVDHAWQPTDYLPDLTAERLGRESRAIPGDRKAAIRRSARHLGGKHGHGRGPAELYGLVGTYRQGSDRYDRHPVGTVAARVDR